MEQQLVQPTSYQVQKDVDNKVNLQETEPRFLLTVILGNIYRHLASIWLFDDHNMVIYKPTVFRNDEFLQSAETGRFVFRLFPGIYRLRLIIDGQFADNKIILDKDKTCSVGNIDFFDSVDQELNPPKLYSSVPLNVEIPYASSFDYYRDAAITISSSETLSNQLGEGHDSGLFIFLRYPSEEIFQEKHRGRTYWNKFALVDSENNLVVQFPEGTHTDSDLQPRQERKKGYLGFSSRLKPGLYFLKYNGIEKRTIPIYVYRNWYSQVFMTLDKEPLFGSIKMLIVNQLKFDPYDSLHAYIDVCLAKLQNEDYTLDHELLRIVSDGKFWSPMLGLLGAFIYMKGKETKNNSLFRIIVSNMQNRILADSNNSPDIYALNFLSYEHFGSTLGEEVKINVIGTPMLRVAYDTLRRVASQYEWVIPAGSLNDAIAEYQIFDSPFNTFRTPPINTPFNPQAPSHDNAVEYRDIKRWQINLEKLWQQQAKSLSEEKLIDKLVSPPIQEDGENAVDSVGQSPNEYIQKSLPDLPSSFGNKLSFNSSKSELENLLKSPKELGRVAAQITKAVLAEPELPSNVIAGRLNMPISTVERLRDQWNIYLG